MPEWGGTAALVLYGRAAARVQRSVQLAFPWMALSVMRLVVRSFRVSLARLSERFCDAPSTLGLPRGTQVFLLLRWRTIPIRTKLASCRGSALTKGGKRGTIQVGNAEVNKGEFSQQRRCMNEKLSIKVSAAWARESAAQSLRTNDHHHGAFQYLSPLRAPAVKREA